MCTRMDALRRVHPCSSGGFIPPCLPCKYGKHDKRYNSKQLRTAKTLSAAIGSDVGTPLFYLNKSKAIALSEELLIKNILTAKAFAILEMHNLSAGHGIERAYKVAIDAGAIIIVESPHAIEK